MKSNGAILLAMMVATSLFDCGQAIAFESEFSGGWRYVERAPGVNKPYSTFNIDLHEHEDGKIDGSYCFITQAGNRIDCDPDGEKNIFGRIEGKGGRAKVFFYSFFGAKGGVAYLTRSGDTMGWTVVKDPVAEPGNSFYGPYSVTLKRDRDTAYGRTRTVVVDKASFYSEPNQSSRTAAYVIKGDRVRLIKVSDDYMFWRIGFPAANGAVLERWIECRSIDLCP